MQSNEDIAQELDYLYNQSGHKAFGLNNDKLLKILFQKNLIERYGNYLALTVLAIEIQENHGGWINFLAKQEKEQSITNKRELELHEATLKSSEATISAAESAETSKNWTIIMGIVAMLSLAWSIYQTILTKNLSDDIELNAKQLKQQDSTIDIQRQQLSNIEKFLNQKKSAK